MMTVEELLQNEDIRYRVSGKDFLVKCLNPNHEDKNPSMRIDQTIGVFNCLSCGFSGNLFSHFGEKPNGLQIKRNRLKSLIDDKLIDVAGLSIPENAMLFEEDWRNISGSTFKEFGAFRHHNTEFIGRVVFPIRSITSKIVAFVGRDMAQNEPKYLNFPPKAKLPLFPTVKPIHGSVMIVEGLLDMLNLHDKGLTNAVCTFGATAFNEDKLNVFKMQGVSNVDIFYDNDVAGQAGSEKVQKLLDKNDISFRNITYTNTNDPGELTAYKVIKLKESLYG